MVAAFLFCLFSSTALAQSATVNVLLSPPGSIKIKASSVRGFAVERFGIYRAENVLVGLRHLKTGNLVCDKQAKKILQTKKWHDAVLVSAVGENGKGKGVIKIRGIARDISGTYRIEGRSLVATFPIKLSDFKFDPITYAGITVQDTAIVTIIVPIRDGRRPASRVH
jgi:hypothetical protein